jgi:D-beta-D-heptose 7-phosphate kinase/D-beta-D-heptose 1-phosphate adenosyltransferase
VEHVVTRQPVTRQSVTRRPRPLVVVGDTLLDRDLVGRVERLAPDAPVPVVALDSPGRAPSDRPRPGGAGLAAVLAARDGRTVTLVTALGDDAAGRELADLLAREGVTVHDLGLAGPTPEKIRVRSDGRSLLRLDRGGTGGDPVGQLTAAARAAVQAACGVLVADYGRGVAAAADVRAALPVGSVPVVWDPHPRGPAPVPGVTLATPNAAEAGIAGIDGGLRHATDRARALAGEWSARAVAVTLGARGALLVTDLEAPPLVVPAARVPCFDPCGAGDRFASTAAGLLADGALASEAVTGAVAAASAFVAAGGAAQVHAPERAPAPAGAREVVDRVRAAGGTVVATGGCFDLLHAGHVAVLQQARSLGDCLVVLLNSDESVRRLKGPSRPLTAEADRAAVLCALGCVDAVVVFGEDTPSRALAELRPDVFAKGGDYAVADLPEAPVVAGWGGQAVVLPYLLGRSTTRLIQEARTRA